MKERDRDKIEASKTVPASFLYDNHGHHHDHTDIFFAVITSFLLLSGVSPRETSFGVVVLLVPGT